MRSSPATNGKAGCCGPPPGRRFPDARAGPGMNAALKTVAPHLWVADRPLRLPFILGDIGCRMTIVRLADGALVLPSPVPLDPETRIALNHNCPLLAIAA